MHQCNGWQGSRLNGWRIVINGKYLTIASMNVVCCTFAAASANSNCLEVLQTTYTTTTTRLGFANLIVTLRLVIIICRWSSHSYESPLSINERQMHLLHCLPSLC